MPTKNSTCFEQVNLEINELCFLFAVPSTIASILLLIAFLLSFPICCFNIEEELELEMKNMQDGSVIRKLVKNDRSKAYEAEE